MGDRPKPTFGKTGKPKIQIHLWKVWCSNTLGEDEIEVRAVAVGWKNYGTAEDPFWDRTFLATDSQPTHIPPYRQKRNRGSLVSRILKGLKLKKSDQFEFFITDHERLADEQRYKMHAPNLISSEKQLECVIEHMPEPPKSRAKPKKV